MKQHCDPPQAYPTKNIPYSLVQAARCGLAGKCAKEVGVAYTKGVALTYISLFLKGGGLREILSKEMEGGLHEGGGLHERVR